MARIGQLRHRATFEVLEASRDPVDGAEVEQWLPAFTTAGELLEFRGREYLAAREVHSEVVAKLTIRYRAEIDPLRWRVTVDGTTYDIEHVVDLAGRRRYLELLLSVIE